MSTRLLKTILLMVGLSLSVSAMAAPDKPGNVWATPGPTIGGCTLLVRWGYTANANNFEVFYRTSPSGSWTSIGLVGNTQSALISSGLTCGTVYDVYVRGFDGSNYGPDSSLSTSVAGSSGVVDVGATWGTITDRIKVTWTPQADAASYKIWFHGASVLATSGGQWNHVGTVSSASAPEFLFDITTTSAWKSHGNYATYRYAVQAVTAGGVEGPFSANAFGYANATPTDFGIPWMSSSGRPTGSDTAIIYDPVDQNISQGDALTYSVAADLAVGWGTITVAGGVISYTPPATNPCPSGWCSRYYTLRGTDQAGAYVDKIGGVYFNSVTLPNAYSGITATQGTGKDNVTIGHAQWTAIERRVYRDGVFVASCINSAWTCSINTSDPTPSLWTLRLMVDGVEGADSNAAMGWPDVAPTSSTLTINATRTGGGSGTPTTVDPNDASGDVITYSIRTQPPAGQGTVTVSGDTFTWTPPAGNTFQGTTTFTYRATSKGNAYLDNIVAYVMVTDAGQLPAPTGFTASDGLNNGTTLSWNAVPGAVSYNVYWNSGGPGATTLVQNTTTTTLNRSNTATYWWAVTAVDASGKESLKSNEDIGWGNIAPSGGTLTMTTDSSSWVAATHTFTDAQFANPYHNESLTISIVSQPAAGQGTASIVGDQIRWTPPGGGFIGTTTFSVKATDRMGLSSNSSTVTVKVAAAGALSAPAWMSCTQGTELLRTRCTWNNVYGASYYNVYYSSGAFIGSTGGDSFIIPRTDATLAGFEVTSVSPSGVESVRSPYANGCANLNPSAASVTTINTTQVAAGTGTGSYTDSTCNPGTYTYSVITQPPAGQGTVTVSGSTFTWTPPAGNGFTGTTTYTFRLDDGRGGYRDGTGTVNVGVYAPTGVAATDGTQSGKVTVTWTALAGAASYKIYRDNVEIGTTATTSFEHVTTAATKGNYQVSGVDAGSVESAKSTADSGWANQPMTGCTATGSGAANTDFSLTVNSGTVAGSCDPNRAIPIWEETISYTITSQIPAAQGAMAVWGEHPTYTHLNKGYVGRVTFGFRVTDLAGNTYDGTGWAVVGTEPPSNVVATDGTLTNKVRVTWTAATGAATYKIYRDGVLVGTTATTSFDHDTGDFAVGSYQVSSVTSGGLETSAKSTADNGYANGAPSAASVSISTNSETVGTGTITGTDPNSAQGDTLTYSVLTQPAAGQGTVSISGTTATWTPPAGNGFAGNTTFTFRATDSAGATFDATGTVTVVGMNDAAFVSHTLPTTMIGNASATVTVTMRNTGAIAWVGGSAPNGYKLGSQDPQDNTKWGLSRYATLPGGTTINTGQEYTFGFNITAPSTPGNYTFKAQMIGGNPTLWFGDMTPTVTINVLGPPNDAPTSVQATDGTLTGKVRITWSDSTEGDTYKVSRKSNSTGYVTVAAAVARGTQMYEDTIATMPGEGGPYTYSVQSCNAAGCGTSAPTDTGYPNVAPTATSATLSATSTSPSTPVTPSVTDANGALGENYTFALLTQPAAGQGTASVTGNQLVYTPPASPLYAGTTTFTYSVTDKGGATVNGTATVTVTAVDLATITSIDGPAMLYVNQGGTVTVVAQNTGTTTWTSASYKAGTDYPGTTATVGAFQGSVPSSTAPGASATISIPITAPATPGTYVVNAKMLHTPASWFGTVSSNFSLTVVGPPATPTGLSATQGTQTGAVVLTWTANGGTTTEGYRLYRATKADYDGGNPTWSVIGTTSAGTTLTDNSPSAATQYAYALTAYNPSGESAKSAAVFGYANVAPSATTASLTATAMTNSGLVTPDVTDANSTAGQTENFTFAITTQPAAGEGTASIVGNKLQWAPPAGNGFAGTATFTYTVTDRAGATRTGTATVTVTAYIPPPPGSLIATQGTITDKVRFTWPAVALTAGYNVYGPGGVLVGTAAGQSTTSLEVVVTNAASVNYTIRAYSASGGESIDSGAAAGWPNIAPTATSTALTATAMTASAATSPNVTDANSAAGQAETFTLAIISQPAAGQGAASISAGKLVWTPPAAHDYAGTTTFQYSVTDKGGATVNGTATVTVTPYIPSAPTAFTATQGTINDKVRLSWNASTNATSYRVFQAGTLVGTVSDSPFDYDTTDVTSKAYTVRAVSASGGESPDSATANGWPNKAPTATDATLTGTAMTASSGVTPSVTDPNTTAGQSETFTFSIGTQPAAGQGTASIVGNKLVWTPPGDFSFAGTTSFGYVVTDKGGATVNGTADVTVTPYIPAPPTAVTATQGTITGKVRVTWNASTHAVSYKVFRSGVQVGTAADTSYEYTTSDVASAGYTVRALSASGGESNSSGAANGWPNLAPTGAAAVLTATSMTASPALTPTVTDPNAQAGQSETYTFAVTVQPAAGQGVASISGNKLVWTPPGDFSFGGATTFGYTVSDKGGATYDAVATVNVEPFEPAAPTAVVATQGTLTGKVRVTWNASFGATTYKVFRAGVQVGSTATTSYEYNTTTVASAGYTVVAASASGGESPPSGSAAGYPNLAPTAATVSGQASASASDQPFNITITDPNLAAGQAESFTYGPASGTTSLGGSFTFGGGKLLYTAPGGGVSGADTLSFTVTDKGGASVAGTGSITVCGAPQLGSGTATINNVTAQVTSAACNGTVRASGVVEYRAQGTDPWSQVAAFNQPLATNGVNSNYTVARAANARAGFYRTTVTVTDADNQSSQATYSFSIACPAPTSTLTAVGGSVDDLNLSAEGSYTSGDVCSSPLTGTLRVFAATDVNHTTPLSTGTLTSGTVTAGSSSNLSWSFPTLPPGDYHVVQRLVAGDGQVGQAVSNFAVTCAMPVIYMVGVSQESGLSSASGLISLSPCNKPAQSTTRVTVGGNVTPMTLSVYNTVGGYTYYKFDYPITGMANGSYPLTVAVTDGFNRTSTKNFTLLVDRGLPSVQLTVSGAVRATGEGVAESLGQFGVKTGAGGLPAAIKQ